MFSSLGLLPSHLHVTAAFQEVTSVVTRPEDSWHPFRSHIKQDISKLGIPLFAFGTGGKKKKVFFLLNSMNSRNGLEEDETPPDLQCVLSAVRARRGFIHSPHNPGSFRAKSQRPYSGLDVNLLTCGARSFLAVGDLSCALQDVKWRLWPRPTNCW